MQTTERRFWIILTVFGGTVFGTGLFAFVEASYGWGFGLSGVGGVAVLALFFYEANGTEGGRAMPTRGLTTFQFVAILGFLILTWAFLGYDIYDRHRGIDWNMPLTQKWGGYYKNETVPLDGIDYINASFENVTMLYDGTAPARLSDVHLVVGSDGKLLVSFKSRNPLVKQVSSLLAGIAKAGGCNSSFTVGQDGNGNSN